MIGREARNNGRCKPQAKHDNAPPGTERSESGSAGDGLSLGTRISRWLVIPLTGFILAYRLTLRPFLGGFCRFEPTCSQYALEALQEHGALGGLRLTTRRLLRCRPGIPPAFDPVPLRAGHSEKHRTQ